MLIEKILVDNDLYGVFEHNLDILSKLSKKHYSFDYSVNSRVLALDHISLIIDPNSYLEDLNSENELIDFLKSKIAVFSEEFISQIINFIRYDNIYFNFKNLDYDETYYLKQFASIVENTEFHGHSVFNELIKIMNIVIENIKFNFTEIDEEIEL